MRIIKIMFLVIIVAANMYAAGMVNMINDSLAENAKKHFSEGVVSGTFTKEDGPFVVTGNIVVPSGEKLEFGPGSLVFIDGSNTSITVYGQFIARGTANDPVTIRSSKKLPASWDWNRIYCRSGELSVFEYCSIRNSNYGITVENGNVEIRNCSFISNSLCAIRAVNSEVSIVNTQINTGHAVGLHVQAGARITADTIKVNDCKNGIICESKAALVLTGGTVSKNINGIIADKNASVAIVAADITLNKYGVVANMEIPRRLREMAYNNYNDMRIVSDKEFVDLISDKTMTHAAVTELKTVKYVQQSTFTSGFSALSVPREPAASFIGNIITGISFYMPKSKTHPVDKDSVEGVPGVYLPVTRRQIRYLGEQSDGWYAGLQPELQVFLNGKRGAADINLILDMYGNEWLSNAGYVRKNMFNLTMSYAQQSLVLGDFYESGSETSLTGRAMTGVNLTGGIFEMGGGVKRIDFHVSAGESEIPKCSGDHELNIFNVDVDSGQAIRQQITYVASLGFKPIQNATVSLKGIIARDQNEQPLLRKKVTDTAVTPVEAQTGVVDVNVQLFKNKVDVSGELDLGSSDSVDKKDRDNIAWYNPQVDKAVPEVFALLSNGKFDNHFAGTFSVKTAINGYTTKLHYQEITKDYFSAGNPYLEVDKRGTSLSMEKQFTGKLFGSGKLGCERTSLSAEPVDRGEIHITAEYQSQSNLPDYSAGYTGRIERCNKTERDSNASQTFRSTQFSNSISIEEKQSFKNGISVSMRYQILIDQDLSDHTIKEYEEAGDRWQNTWYATFGFKVKKMIRNKTTFRLATKSENSDSLRAVSWKIGDNLYVDIIKGKLSLKLTGEYSNKDEKKYSDAWLPDIETEYYTADAEVKYSFTPRVSLTAHGGYARSYDETTGSTDNYSAGLGGIHLTYLF